MKQVVLIIGGRYQSNACGFIRAYEQLGGKLDHILCLQAPRGIAHQLKKALRAAKVLEPSSIKGAIVRALCKAGSMQEMSTLRSRWNNAGENSWDLLKDSFDIFKYAVDHKVPLHFFPALTAGVVEQFAARTPTIFPMYGGGIVPEELIRNERAEFVNAHMGEMPRYRGMNVLEWAVAEGADPKVAVMVMNEKIDGGDVIHHMDIRIEGVTTIADLRRIGYEHCYKAMAQGVFRYQGDPSLRTSQSPGARYYYRMHQAIRKLVLGKLLAAAKGPRV